MLDSSLVLCMKKPDRWPTRKGMQVVAQRKTIDRNDLVERANTYILYAHEDEREALCSLIESVLIDGNAYKGFQWIDDDGQQIPTEQAKNMKNGVHGYWRRRYY